MPPKKTQQPSLEEKKAKAEAEAKANAEREREAQKFLVNVIAEQDLLERQIPMTAKMRPL